MAIEPQVGDQFGPFRIIGQIGQGGMGVVFTAIEEGLGRTVALKVVAPQLATTAEFRARFQREAAVLARSESPNIVPVYSYGEHDGCLFLCMQYVAGGDLGVFLETRGPLAADLALGIVAQVADGLADAHRAGVIHRDVKPSNVLVRPVSSEGAGEQRVHVYLCDFGIARGQEAGLTEPGHVAGSYQFLAPERLEDAEGSAASDIYALGCLLYMCLTGRPPYDGSMAQLIHLHASAPIPVVPSAAVGINQFIASAMAKEPARRPASAEAAATRLRRLIGQPSGQTTQRPQPPPSENGIAAPRPRPSDVATRPPLTGAVGIGGPGAQHASNTSTSAGSDRSWAPVIAAMMLLAAVVGGAYLLVAGTGDDGGTVTATPTRAESHGSQTRPSSAGTTDDPDSGPGTATAGAQTPAPGSPNPDQRADPEPGGPVTRSDVDGDNRDDLIIIDNQRGSTSVALSAGEGEYGPLREWSPTDFGSAKVVRADYTGDGLADLGIVGGGRVQVAASVGDSFAEPQEWAAGLPTGELKVVSADYDGDGLLDLAVLSGGEPLVVDALLSTGSSFSRVSRWAQVPGWPVADVRIVSGDYTGDGLADIGALSRDGAGITFEVVASTGTGLSAPKVWFRDPTLNLDNTRVLTGNYDGDVDADVMVLQQGSGLTLSFLQSDGTRLRRHVWNRLDLSSPLADLIGASADLDGRGRTDLLLIDRVDSRLHAYRPDGLTGYALGTVPLGLTWADAIIVGHSR